MLKLIRVPPETVETALGVSITMPAVAVLGVDEGRIVGSGGLAWGAGRSWIWFRMTERKAAYAVPIVRETRRMLRRAAQLGEAAVFTARDQHEPASQKLLQILGFEFHGNETDADGVEREVWACRVLN